MKIFFCVTMLMAVIHTKQAIAQHQPGSSEHSFHRHHIAFFFGATNEQKRDENNEGHQENAITFGAEYEYRFHKYVGVGGLFDYAGGDIRSDVTAAAVYLHPAAGFKITLAPGVERKEAHNDFVFRLGFGYDIPVGWLILSPGVNIDFVDGEQIFVYGVAFGFGF